MSGRSRRADRRAGRDAGGVRGARPDRLRGAAERQADDRHRADLGLRARRRARLRGRRDRRADIQLLLRPGAVDPVADGRLGSHRDRRGRPGADLASRTIGRWPLAIACCVCGFAFTAVQDAADWITYSDHSVAQLGVYVGQGLGFDAIYAGSCLVFALAFGPALLRSIQRFTKRLEITWLAPGSSVAPCWRSPWRWSGPRRSPAALRRRQRVPPACRCSGRSTICCGPRTTTAASAPGRPAVERAVRRVGGARPGVRGRAAAERRPRAGADRLFERAAGAKDAGSIERNILVARAAGLSAPTSAGTTWWPCSAPHSRATARWRRRQPDRRSGSWRCARPRWPCRRGPTPGCWPAGPRRGVRLRARRGRPRTSIHRRRAPGAGIAVGFGAAGVRARAIAYVRRQQDHDGGFPRSQARAPTRSRPPGRSKDWTPLA